MTISPRYLCRCCFARSKLCFVDVEVVNMVVLCSKGGETFVVTADYRGVRNCPRKLEEAESLLAAGHMP